MKNLKANSIDILERSVKYSLKIVKFYRQLEKDSVGRILGKQLLRSGTSIGANIYEAQGGQSKADFIAKISIAYKESRETAYWLRIMQESEMKYSKEIDDLKDETEQLIKILSSILLSSKQGLERQ
ncbi:MAG: four helix bundle protein [Proteobacteria bacterium]|nr:four helix bundle protein [Pseudomonadota bacterium]